MPERVVPAAEGETVVPAATAGPPQMTVVAPSRVDSI
jgi:hypothetical protein